MLVERGNYRHCYEIIRRDGYQTPILIYVSTSDVDALCAYRILKSMFQSDNVPFSVFPVSGSEELRKRGKETRQRLFCVEGRRIAHCGRRALGGGAMGRGHRHCTSMEIPRGEG